MAHANVDTSLTVTVFGKTYSNEKVTSSYWDLFCDKKFLSIIKSIQNTKRLFISLTNGEDAISVEQANQWIENDKNLVEKNIKDYLDAGFIKLT